MEMPRALLHPRALDLSQKSDDSRFRFRTARPGGDSPRPSPSVVVQPCHGERRWRTRVRHPAWCATRRERIRRSGREASRNTETPTSPRSALTRKRAVRRLRMPRHLRRRGRYPLPAASGRHQGTPTREAERFPAPAPGSARDRRSGARRPSFPHAWRGVLAFYWGPACALAPQAAQGMAAAMGTGPAKCRSAPQHGHRHVEECLSARAGRSRGGMCPSGTIDNPASLSFIMPSSLIRPCCETPPRDSFHAGHSAFRDAGARRTGGS